MGGVPSSPSAALIAMQRFTHVAPTQVPAGWACDFSPFGAIEGVVMEIPPTDNRAR